jgi:hypothetical protein
MARKLSITHVHGYSPEWRRTITINRANEFYKTVADFKYVGTAAIN